MIDETDRMLERNHFEELHKLLELLNADQGNTREKPRQTLVFSATLSLVHDVPQHVLKKSKGKADKKQRAKDKLGEVSVRNYNTSGSSSLSF